MTLCPRRHDRVVISLVDRLMAGPGRATPANGNFARLLERALASKNAITILQPPPKRTTPAPAKPSFALFVAERISLGARRLAELPPLSFFADRRSPLSFRWVHESGRYVHSVRLRRLFPTVHRPFTAIATRLAATTSSSISACAIPTSTLPASPPQSSLHRSPM